MIAELVRYADSKGITGIEPFHARPVHWFIDLDADGNPLALTPTTRATKTSKGGGEERGKTMCIPSNYLLGAPNQSNWRADFLVGPANEIFPKGVDGENPLKSDRQKGFRELITSTQQALPDNHTLQAIKRFLDAATSLDRLPLPSIMSKTIKDENGRERTKNDLSCFCKKGDYPGETIGFRIEGTPAFKDPELVSWWRDEGFRGVYENQTSECTEIGNDAFQPGTGRITDSSPCIFGNVPIVSFGKAPFSSFGLSKNTARLRLDTAEKASAAINALNGDKTSSLNLGDQKAIFWAMKDGQMVDCSFIGLLAEPDTLAVRDFLNSPWGGMPPNLDTAAFHVAILKSGTGRFSLRSSGTPKELGEVKSSIQTYFEAIRLLEDAPINLGRMATATIAKSKKSKPAARTYTALFDAAWQGKPIPHQLMAATVNRQSLELAKGYVQSNESEFFWRRKARTALLKLYFKTNHDKTMNENNHETENNPAYLCGRVLALMDIIHNKAHKNTTASSPAGRFYGAASSTPAIAFPRLCKLARIHLDKIGGEFAHKLEHGVPKEKSVTPIDRDFEGLAQLIARFEQDASWPRTLSLEEQGRFAIGFYYERCRKWPNYKKGTNPKGDDDEASDKTEITSSQPESENQN
ncbi:MAG: type I-C CRISPR-associated protein Cas8c/Csd1 [Verrucomicrobia bacterium]|nr:type I-C CRISPR-associated protein Cas8c/Csd1 [Verrucomicrobiota bacterium]